MHKHVTIAAILRIGLTPILLIEAALIPFLLLGVGILFGDDVVQTILVIIGMFLAFILASMSLPNFIGGLGLLTWQPWARNLMLIVSVIDLINAPFGTLLGAYSIWVLSHKDTVALFRRLKE